MRVAVAGVGVVGGALVEWLTNHTKHEPILYDPPKGMTGSIRNADCTFICVPVPTTFFGRQDLSIINDLRHVVGDGPIFVRSTVLPRTCDNLAAEWGKRVYHAPEFLTERRAYEDMQNLPLVCGSRNHPGDSDIFDAVFNSDMSTAKPVMYVSNVEAELGKYFHNVLGAVNVHISNIFFALALKYKGDYDRIKRIAQLTGFAPREWMNVPGPDGDLGFGGKCFPKDLQALAGTIESDLLRQVWKENAKVRTETRNGQSDI